MSALKRQPRLGPPFSTCRALCFKRLKPVFIAENRNNPKTVLKLQVQLRTDARHVHIQRA